MDQQELSTAVSRLTENYRKAKSGPHVVSAQDLKDFELLIKSNDQEFSIRNLGLAIEVEHILKELKGKFEDLVVDFVEFPDEYQEKKGGLLGICLNLSAMELLANEFYESDPEKKLEVFEEIKYISQVLVSQFSEVMEPL
jgi:hypothetical protein